MTTSKESSSSGTFYKKFGVVGSRDQESLEQGAGREAVDRDPEGRGQ